MHKSINWNAVSFDWNHVRAFLAAAEQGSLSGAARVLGQTQPTLSRQISSLEDDLGVLLLERGTRGLTLTDPGMQLLEHVSAMGQAALQLSLAASGQSAAIEGHVLITATNAFATFHLPRMLQRVRVEAPLISLTVVASNEVRDITRREADIAIRHAQPMQPDLIGKQVGAMQACLYASKSYLQKHGRPDNPEQCASLDFIGFENPATLVPVFKSLGIPVLENQFKISTASGTALMEMVRLGLGASILTTDVEDLFPEFERVLPSLNPIPVPVWLVTHRELRTSRRIRVVYDVLEEEIRRYMGTQ
ncbi:MAG: LysR family transcriptional regulator [Granulosicoccus sp.]|nr:LysR family transcriptional regulator [Granulosicoccus sp.]